MTYGEKYRITFKDRFGRTQIIYIKQANYSGSVTHLKAGETPYTINLQVSDDWNHFNPFRVTSLEFNIIKETEIDFSDIFDAGMFDFEVSVYIDSALEWSGFITPDGLVEPYKMLPYEMPFRAVDGIGYLQQFQFLDDAGNNYRGLQTIKTVLHICLDKINYSGLNYYYSFPLTHSKVEVYGGDYLQNLFEFQYIDCSQFGSDSATDSCYDVIRKILSSYNLSLQQNRGRFEIVDITSFWEEHYYNIYNTRTGFVSSGKEDTVVELSNGNDSSLCAFVNESAQIRRVPAWSGFEVDYKDLFSENTPFKVKFDAPERVINQTTVRITDVSDLDFLSYEGDFYRRPPGYVGREYDLQKDKYYFRNYMAESSFELNIPRVEFGETFNLDIEFECPSTFFTLSTPSFEDWGYRGANITMVVQNGSKYLNRSGIWVDNYTFIVINQDYEVEDFKLFRVNIQPCPNTGPMNITFGMTSYFDEVFGFQLADGEARIYSVFLNTTQIIKPETRYYFSAKEGGSHVEKTEMFLRDGIVCKNGTDIQKLKDWTYVEQWTRLRGEKISDNVIQDLITGLSWADENKSSGYLIRDYKFDTITATSWSTYCYTLLQYIGFKFWEQHKQPLWMLSGSLLAYNIRPDTILIDGEGRRYMLQTLKKNGYTQESDVEFIEIKKPRGTNNYIQGDFNNDFNNDFLI